MTLATALAPLAVKVVRDTAPWASISTRPAPVADKLAVLSTRASPTVPMAALDTSATLPACKSAKPACVTPRMLPLAVLKDARPFTRKRCSDKSPLSSLR